MDDLISRQAAIDAIEQHKTAVLGEREWDEGIAYGYEAAHRHLVDIVKQLPSAERRGRWMDHSDEWDGGYYECSVCGEAFTFIEGTPKENLYNYCPNCGTKMEV